MSDAFEIASQNSLLLLAIFFSCLVTILLKTVPISVLKGNSIPKIVRQWLDFVPVAVMAALVGPDIFIYDGHFNLTPANLFLIVSIPTFFVAWLSKNYFVTIACGLCLIITLRYFGFN